jgi:CRP-like cAMP-binding protein
MARRSKHDRGRLDLAAFMATGDSLVAPEDPSTTVFLASGTESEWARIIDRSERRVFEAGEVVGRAGEVDRSLLILRSGRLGFYLPDEDDAPFSIVDAPSVVGEVAFFDGLPRSGTLRAIDAGMLLRLSFSEFEALAAEAPHLGTAILVELGRILATRLRSVLAVAGEL